MSIRRETIGNQLKRIRRGFKRRNLATGQLYNTASDQRRKPKKITLLGLFVSDQKTFLIRPHLFEAKKARTATEWEAWLAVHYGTILRNSIIPNMELRTEKQWRLYRLIGWVANDRAKSLRAKTYIQRDKTE